MSDEDLELMAIKMRKMRELQKLYLEKAQKKPEPDDFALVRSKLTGRGQEVLEAALSQYPKTAREVVKYLAELYRSGRLAEEISGEELYTLFCDLGMPIRLETSITYVKDGKRISISDKLRSKED